MASLHEPRDIKPSRRGSPWCAGLNRACASSSAVVSSPPPHPHKAAPVPERRRDIRALLARNGGVRATALSCELAGRLTAQHLADAALPMRARDNERGEMLAERRAGWPCSKRRRKLGGRPGPDGGQRQPATRLLCKTRCNGGCAALPTATTTLTRRRPKTISRRRTACSERRPGCRAGARQQALGTKLARVALWKLALTWTGCRSRGAPRH